MLATQELVLGLNTGKKSCRDWGTQEALPLGGGALGRQLCLPSSLPLGSWPWGGYRLAGPWLLSKALNDAVLTLVPTGRY